MFTRVQIAVFGHGCLPDNDRDRCVSGGHPANRGREKEDEEEEEEIEEILAALAILSIRELSKRVCDGEPNGTCKG